MVLANIISATGILLELPPLTGFVKFMLVVLAIAIVLGALAYFTALYQDHAKRKKQNRHNARG